MIHRVLEPELLDQLPPDDPRAVGSRRDLQRVNLWMRNGPHLIRAIRDFNGSACRIVELGAGDGTFMLKIAQKLRRAWSHPVELQLLDLNPVVQQGTLDAFAAIGWKAQILKTDAREWFAQARTNRVDLIVANLFLHHFTPEDLRGFFSVLPKLSGGFVACDPRRWRPAILATRLLWLIGCNEVTRHDGRASVRAGFAGNELTELWPRESGFRLREYEAGYASHIFAAARQY